MINIYHKMPKMGNQKKTKVAANKRKANEADPSEINSKSKNRRKSDPVATQQPSLMEGNQNKTKVKRKSAPQNVVPEGSLESNEGNEPEFSGESSQNVGNQINSPKPGQSTIRSTWSRSHSRSKSQNSKRKSRIIAEAERAESVENQSCGRNYRTQWCSTGGGCP